MMASVQRLRHRIGGWATHLRYQRQLLRGRRALAASKLFDPQWYRATYGLEPGAKPLRHCLAGPPDRRPSPWFDAIWYLGRYPDVSRSGLHPLTHYILFGAKEGRSPNPYFATRWYLDNHPQAANYPTPLDHYISVGATQLADPSPSFDAAWYAANVMEESEHNLDPLAHFLLSGRTAGAQTQAHSVAELGESVELARLETFKPLEPAHGQVVALVTATAQQGRLTTDAGALIEVLAALKVRVVLVVQTDTLFAPDPDLVPLLAGGFVREARGHRFAAWAHLMRAEPLLFSGDILLLLNGDIPGRAARAAFKSLLQRIRASSADVLGVMVPGSARRRLDSDLLAFKSRALIAPTFHNLFGGLTSSEEAEREVRPAFEVKLTEAIQSSDLLIDALPAGPLQTFGEDVAVTRPKAGPQRPAHGARTASLLAPGSISPASAPWKIAFIGPWNFASGLSQAGRGNISALWRTGVRLNVYPIEGPFHVHKRVTPIAAACDFEGAADAVIVHLNPDAWGVLTPAQHAIIRNARVRIGLWVWEMGHVPEDWLPVIETVDEIWTPSHYCADVLSAQTRKPVTVVPHVVATPPMEATTGAAVLGDLGLEADARIILYVFDAASFIQIGRAHV